VILILTAGFGDGHNTAARNTARALERLVPEEEMRVEDIFDAAMPFFSPAMKMGYQALITRAPWLWSLIYRNTQNLQFDSGTFDSLLALRNRLHEILREHKPRAIVTTYPLYPKLVDQLREAGVDVPPVYTVVTDSISIHPIWALAPSRLYFAADEASKTALAAHGVAAEKIIPSGFPVSLDFLNEPQPPADAPAEGRIIYLPSTSVSHVAQTLEALRPLIASGVELTLPVGKHKARLYLTYTRFMDSLPNARINILGWTNQIPHLLQTHDLVICKAGGAILHESLAARCPAIIDYIVPGQEEGNAELLTSHQCGIISNSAKQTGELATRLLANGAAEAKRMKENARALCEPGAAMKIAEAVLKDLPSA